jgi:hypothetical protein
MNNQQTENMLAAVREALVYHGKMLEELAVRIDMVITKMNEEK